MEQGEYEQLHEDVESLLCEVDEALDRLVRSVRRLRDVEGQPNELGALLSTCDEQQGVARRLLREVEIELGGSTLGARAAGYELEYNRRRSQLDELCRSVSLGRERHALFGARSPRPGELSSLGPREILARAEAVQDESVAAVHRMHRMASSALEIGQETLGSLGAQRERVRNLAATAAALDAQLNLAGLELHHFIGKMCGDAITVVLASLIALGVVVIVVWQMTTAGLDWVSADSGPRWPSEIEDPLSDDGDIYHRHADVLFAYR